MSKSSRRKTLSHSEIESFLSEISVVKSDENTVQSSICQDKAVKANLDDCPNVGMDYVANERQWIRDLCKIKFNNPNKSSMQSCELMCELGRKILNNTNYPIIPTRRTKPELFQFSASSLDGKKTLLLSLSPMLADNENQRKLDIAACENFTRCRSTKGRGRFSNYEYFDIDLQTKVDYDEFEKRYLMFIHDSQKTFLSHLFSPANKWFPAAPVTAPIKPYIPEMILPSETVVQAQPMAKDVLIKKKSEVTVFEQTTSTVNTFTSSYSSIRRSSLTMSSSQTASKENNAMYCNMTFEDRVSPNIAVVKSVALGDIDSPYVIGSPVPAKKSRDQNDKKRKNTQSTTTERRVTLSPATARAMMMRAFEEDEPTTFPVRDTLVIDHDLGANRLTSSEYVSPSRVLEKEITVCDVFSNPEIMDCADEEQDAANQTGCGISLSPVIIDVQAHEIITGSLNDCVSMDVADVHSLIADLPFETVISESTPRRLSLNLFPEPEVVEKAPSSAPFQEDSESLEDLLHLAAAIGSGQGYVPSVNALVMATSRQSSPIEAHNEVSMDSAPSEADLSRELDSLLSDSQPDESEAVNEDEDDDFFGCTNSPGGFLSLAARHSQPFCFDKANRLSLVTDTFSSISSSDSSSVISSSISNASPVTSPEDEDQDLSPLLFSDERASFSVTTRRRQSSFVQSRSKSANEVEQEEYEVVSESVEVSVVPVVFTESVQEHQQQEEDSVEEEMFSEDMAFPSQQHTAIVGQELVEATITLTSCDSSTTSSSSSVESNTSPGISPFKSEDFKMSAHHDLDVSVLVVSPSSTAWRGSSFDQDDDLDFELMEGLVERGEVATTTAPQNAASALTNSLYAFCNSANTATINTMQGEEEEDADSMLEAELLAFESAEDGYDYFQTGEQASFFSPAATPAKVKLCASSERKEEAMKSADQKDEEGDSFMCVETIQSSPETTSSDSNSGNSSSSDDNGSFMQSDNVCCETVVESLSVVCDVMNPVVIPVPVEQSIDFVFDAPLDFGLAQERAYKKRLERFDVARWKYQWELVSVKAANVAIQRAHARQGNM